MWVRKTGIDNKNGCRKREAFGNGAMKEPLKFHPLTQTKGFIALAALKRLNFFLQDGEALIFNQHKKK